MIRTRLVCACLTVLCLLTVCPAALAREVDCDATYCFTSEDFSSEETLLGICITELPQSNTGTVFLGTRVLRPGDILTTQQLEQMTFSPLRTQQDQQAVVTFLPIYEGRVEKPEKMTISIRGKEDKAPVAEDFTLETYKNLPNTGKLKVTDPEGQPLTCSIIRQPRRGEVVVQADGSFCYTPKKNKVGVDSFTYTATDPSGNVSREATVTVQILKPTDAQQYTDTVGSECRFAAEWMRNTGLFVGERVGGQDCFYPEKQVSRGDFLTMVVKLLQVPMDDAPASSPATQNAPAWLRPYLAAAIRSGLVANTPFLESGAYDQPITGGEAAVIVQNALDLSLQTSLEETDEDASWADTALAVMSQNGISLTADAPLTRGEVAQFLYRVNELSREAPGMMVLRKQK